jgi:succinoglycan biosynthesis protein ExoA
MSPSGADCLIVIPCLNEAGFIGGLLDQLLADRDAEGALIVVADGGSTDRTREIVSARAASEPRLRLLDNPKRIQSAAINLAVVRFGAGRRWLVRIDAHAGYPEAYVSRLLAAACSAAAASVVVPMITQDHGGCFQVAAAAAQNSPLGTGGSAHRHAGRSDWVDHGHHALFELEAFVAIGGYDEGFSHNEDAELDARLTRAGGRIWLAGDIPIVYYPRSAPGPLFRQYFKYGEGRAKTRRRHSAPLKLRQMAPLAVAPACLLALLSLLSWPLFWPLALPALAWAAAALGFGLLLGLKRKQACAAGAGAAAMIMHFAWSLGYLRQAVLGPPPGAEPGALRREIG